MNRQNGSPPGKSLSRRMVDDQVDVAVGGGDAVVRGCTFTGNGGEMADSVDMLVISSHDVLVESNIFDGAGATERGLDDRSLDTFISANSFSGYQVNAVKIGPYFSAIVNMSKKLDAAGAAEGDLLLVVGGAANIKGLEKLLAPL